MIQCSEIENEINRLRIKLNGCANVTGRDLLEVLNIIEAVRHCEQEGPGYNYSKKEHHYSGDVPIAIDYPMNMYHSMSICVMSGSMKYEGFDFQAGAVRNIEVSSLNQTTTSFIINPGSSVFVEYITNTP